MKQIIFTTLFTILLTANQEILEDFNTTTEDTNITQIEDSNLSESEMIEYIMKADKEILKKETRLKNLKKLEKTVDELSKHLNIDN
jgi:hypothetical protein